MARNHRRPRHPYITMLSLLNIFSAFVEIKIYIENIASFHYNTNLQRPLKGFLKMKDVDLWLGIQELLLQCLKGVPSVRNLDCRIEQADSPSDLTIEVTTDQDTHFLIVAIIAKATTVTIMEINNPVNHRGNLRGVPPSLKSPIIAFIAVTVVHI